jgi:hypothetical protein
MTTSAAGTLAAHEISRVAMQKIFFGHQSVGDDIIRGLEDICADSLPFKLKVIASAHPQSVAAPAFVECHVGRNGDTQSKVSAFTAILDKGMGNQGGIAMFKFCFADIAASTDIATMFESYRQAIDALKTKYPRLQIVHATVPLTVDEPPVKVWIKRALGRAIARDVHCKRNEYNRLLIRTYAGRDPIFDLAAIESTHPDGTLCSFGVAGEQIFTLAPEFTTDGGHLNELGRRAAAEGLLRVLAKL